MNKKFLLFCLILVSFCISSVFADFTIGIYCVGKAEDIKIVKDAGFNTVQTYNKDPKIIYELAKEAKKQNITLLAYPDKVFGSQYQKKLQQYPIIWYLCDEPDLWKISKQKLQFADDKVRKYFPAMKTAFVLGEGNPKVSYYDIADILMVDWYPVPHLPLESLGEQISYARHGLDSAKGTLANLWAVVQMFDWTEERALSSSARQKYNLRFPTKEEIRFMSYDALFNGATGLFYFQYNSKKKPLPQSRPDEWTYVVDVVQELVFTTKLFEQGNTICDPTCDKRKNKCEYCRGDTFTITGNESFIKMKSFEYDDAKYTILINPTSKHQTIPKIFYEKKFDVIFEQETELAKIIKNKKDNFEPYKVLVFRYN